MDRTGVSAIDEAVSANVPDMVALLKALVEIPAMGPECGGEGESAKVAHIIDRCVAYGLTDLESHDAVDARVESGMRPNLAVSLRGRAPSGRTVVLTHTDVVPPGDLSAWSSDPFTAVERDGRIHGRGAEDNGQSIVSSLFALKVLRDLGQRPPRDAVVVMAADEEADNQTGVLHLIRREYFRKDDLIVVADHGEPAGRLVATAEKSLLWLQVLTRGKQVHASRPDLGVNAFRAAMAFWASAEPALAAGFGRGDDFYDHPRCTFEPTQRLPNVTNINTIPGEDTFFLDCRLLPGVSADAVLETLKEVAHTVGEVTGAQHTLRVVQRADAPAETPVDSAIVKRILDAVASTLGNDPYPGGIGGQTFASPLRAAGLQAVAWETVDNTAHAPDEYARIENLVNDCRVFARVFMGP